jgi:hypothetical protein
VRGQLKHQPADTLYVFADQALGPWVPLVKNKPHVVHAHDLLALRSALGEIPENPTSWSGRLYQRYIRHGFKQAKHFISVSKKTRDDLITYGQVSPVISEVVYNGLNYPYLPMPETDAKPLLAKAGLPMTANGLLLHLGGSQWYKNLAEILKGSINWQLIADNYDEIVKHMVALKLGIVTPSVLIKRFSNNNYLRQTIKELKQIGKINYL